MCCPSLEPACCGIVVGTMLSRKWQSSGYWLHGGVEQFQACYPPPLLPFLRQPLPLARPAVPGLSPTLQVLSRSSCYLRVGAVIRKEERRKGRRACQSEKARSQRRTGDSTACQASFARHGKKEDRRRGGRVVIIFTMLSLSSCAGVGAGREWNGQERDGKEEKGRVDIKGISPLWPWI